ncbi:pinensin family lanthipeptide [Roseivirga sp. BDSF3-8]|uniref:pinensin family lanthipeptide n=1 Tax=Roseivirga sp. BDSF3-8 TaxID=3241598 RepID=UPI0035326266
MKKTKMHLKQLEVQSFVTAEHPKSKQTAKVKGGATAYHYSGCYTDCGMNTCAYTCDDQSCQCDTWCSECYSLRLC